MVLNQEIGTIYFGFRPYIPEMCHRSGRGLEQILPSCPKSPTHLLSHPSRSFMGRVKIDFVTHDPGDHVRVYPDMTH